VINYLLLWILPIRRQVPITDLPDIEMIAASVTNYL